MRGGGQGTQYSRVIDSLAAGTITRNGGCADRGSGPMVPAGTLAHRSRAGSTGAISEFGAGPACGNEGARNGPSDRPGRSGTMGGGRGGAHSDHAQMQKATRPTAESIRPKASARPEPVTTAVPRPQTARKANRAESAAISGAPRSVCRRGREAA